MKWNETRKKFDRDGKERKKCINRINRAVASTNTPGSSLGVRLELLKMASDANGGKPKAEMI